MPDAGWPKKRLKVVIARPIGKFKNGPVEGELSGETIDQIVRNFARTTKVPVFLWTHVDDLDDMPPDGWAYGLTVAPSGHLVADIEVMGDAVAVVEREQIRSASIAWNPEAKDYSGAPIGPLLMHITLTNNPYIKDLPSIAARDRGGAGLLVCFTALTHKEGDMPDPEKKQEPDQADKDRVDPTAPEVTVAALKAKDDEIYALKGKLLAADESIEELKGKLDAKPVDIEKEDLAIRLKKAEFQLDAMSVRELVEQGLTRGTLKPSWCARYKDGGHAGTMSWFKASRFDGDMKLLKWAVENNPTFFTQGKAFNAGTPKDPGELNLSEEDRASLRELGIKPELVLAARKARNITEFKELAKES